MVQFVHTMPMHLQKWQKLFTIIIHVGSSAIGLEISLPGYIIFRRDRDRHGGGVLIFVKTELCASVVPFSEPMANLEFLPIVFTFCELKFCIAVFYRPPSSDVHYFDNFCSVVENLNIVNYSNFIWWATLILIFVIQLTTCIQD